MRRIICALLPVLLLLCACGPKEYEVPEADVPVDYTAEEKLPEEKEEPMDLDFILDRQVYQFKKEMPELYSVVRGLEETASYRENWTFRKILNDRHFGKIQWTKERVNDRVEQVIFRGETLRLPQVVQVKMGFYIQEGATIPICWLLETDNGEELTQIDLQRFLDQGMDEEYSIFALDSTVCTMVMALADELSDGAEAASTSGIETAEDFFEQVGGIWGYRRDDGFWEVLQFEDGTINDFTYAGHIWVCGGTIESLEQVSGGALKVEVVHQEVLYGEPDREGEMLEATYYFKSNDNYERSLIVENTNQDLHYVYLGSTMEEAESFLL